MLEALIRPFQRPTSISTGRVVVATAKKQPVAEAKIVWGATGSLPTAVAGLGGGGLGATIDSHILTGDTQNAEKPHTRVTVQKRIENPDDPNQFVMVEDTQAITFTAKSKSQFSSTLVVNPTTGTVSSATGGATNPATGSPVPDSGPFDVSFSFDDSGAT